MTLPRREFLASGLAAVAVFGAAPLAASQTGGSMYGLIGKAMCVPGKRDEFIGILLEGVGEMPGCISYIVARDPNDGDALWITEVWDSEASHAASLSLPAVKAAIAKGRSLIAGFGERYVTEPVGGYGLKPAGP